MTGNQDNPANFGFFVLVIAAGVGAFAMVGVAGVQAILTALAVTDPATDGDPRGVSGVLLLSGYFTSLWLIAAAAFRRAARQAELSQAID